MSLLKRMLPGRALAEGEPADYALQMALVYQDNETRRWAEEVHDLAAQAVGQQAIRAGRWAVHELSRPGALTAAVSQAIRSDLIVVAVRAAEELPLTFYLWTDLWLSHSPGESSALVALIGTAEARGAALERTRQYLGAISRRGQLELFVQERSLPAAAPAVAAEPAQRSQALRRRSRAPRGAWALPVAVAT